MISKRTRTRYNARLRHGHILVPDDELRRAFKKRATRDDGLAGRPQLLSLLEELYGSLRVKVRALEKHADFGAWKLHDTIEVAVSFESSTAARVTFSFKGRTLTHQLEGVPACGLCFGAGLQRKHDGATLVASSFDAGVA